MTEPSEELLAEAIAHVNRDHGYAHRTDVRVARMAMTIPDPAQLSMWELAVIGYIEVARRAGRR